MTASIYLPEGFDASSIASLAGQEDNDKFYLKGGRLHVLDVTQQALDLAYAAYDPVVTSRDSLVIYLKSLIPERLITKVSFYGVVIQTDEVTLVRLNNKIQALRQNSDPLVTTNWRGGEGDWHEVSLSTLEELGVLADEHWQKVFDAYRFCEEKILAGEFTTKEQIKEALDERTT